MNTMRHTFQRVRWCTMRLLPMVSALGLGACSDSMEPTQISVPVTDVLSRVVVTPRAIMLEANGDSIRLTPTALNLYGDTISMAGGASVIWRTTDTRIVVDSNGWARARGATTINDMTYLTATWSHNGVTTIDSVLVYATATRLPIASLKIVPTDSTRTSYNAIPGSTLQLTRFSLVALDSNETVVHSPRVLLKTTSLGAEVFSIGPLNILLSLKPGDYWVHASSSVYGVPMRDSVKYTGLYLSGSVISNAQDPIFGHITSPYTNTETEIQPCGEIQFSNTASVPVDIIFDDPDKVSGCRPTDPTGNITGLASQGTVRRKFPVVGTVRWTIRNPAAGPSQPTISGTIAVKNP